MAITEKEIIDQAAATVDLFVPDLEEQERLDEKTKAMLAKLDACIDLVNVMIAKIDDLIVRDETVTIFNLGKL